MMHFKNHGYFINKDGQKSCDMVPPNKKFKDKFDEGTVMPKKPFSSFLLFSNQKSPLIREKMTQTNQNMVEEERLNHQQLTTLIAQTVGNMWK